MTQSQTNIQLRLTFEIQDLTWDQIHKALIDADIPPKLIKRMVEALRNASKKRHNHARHTGWFFINTVSPFVGYIPKEGNALNPFLTFIYFKNWKEATAKFNLLGKSLDVFN